MTLPRLVDEKIGFYLYHWKHIKLMKEIKQIIPCYLSDGIYVKNEKYGTKLFMYRKMSLMSSPFRNIYNNNLDRDTGQHCYNRVAVLPKNYWYSNGDQPS